mgnify:CR=1 FL=1
MNVSYLGKVVLWRKKCLQPSIYIFIPVCVVPFSSQVSLMPFNAAATSVNLKFSIRLSIEMLIFGNFPLIYVSAQLSLAQTDHVYLSM